MNRNALLLVVGVLAGVSGVVSGIDSAPPPPHKEHPAKTPPQTKGPRRDVLFIAIDDMNDWTTLFDKSNPIKTPNLERLAARGCFFTRAYCAAPGCNPSRTAVMTGLRPTTSGVYGNGDPWKKYLPDVVTLPQHFMRHGYAAKGAGKIFHHGPSGADRPDNPSFQQFFKLQLHANKPDKNYNGYVRGKGGHPLGSASFDWGVHDVAKQTDEYTVEWVSNVMATHPKDKPLFLAAGIFRPHLPFWAPPATFARYPFDKVRQPPMPAGDLDDVPPIGRKMAHTEHFIWLNTTKQPKASAGSLKRMTQCYQASADYADEMVGRLLDKLDATGRADNTIIVLWADHGYHLGDKQACVKFTLWEKANRVPFLIVAPGVTRPGARCDRPVGLVDIYPTLIELAGLPPRPGLDGQSLVPLLKAPDAKWDRPALMTWGRGNHAVRSERWRYIRYSDGTEELYDHDNGNDPWEWKNLAGDAKYADVIAQHKKWLPKTEAPVGAPGRAAKVTGGYIPPPADPDAIPIADFESGTYGEWKVEGTAFGKAPAIANVTPHNLITGHQGKRLVNSFLGGDRPTGTLTSPPFTIQRKHINFLIGAGRHPGETCMNLLVEGKVVRTAVGFAMKVDRKELLDWRSWNVAEFAGKTARLRIVDAHSGVWGHINVDQIMQSDIAAKTTARPGEAPPPPRRAAPTGLLIADFRKTSLPPGWKVEGYAFGARTAGPDRQQAARTTANQRQYQSGTLTSPTFKIARPYLVMELTGVYHPTKCCVALMIAGQDVRRVSPNPTGGSWRSMDVRDLVGKTAQLQVRDDHFNGWIEPGRMLQADEPVGAAQKTIPLWEPTVFEKTIDAAYLLLPVNGESAPLQTVTLEVDGKTKLEADIPLAMGDTTDLLPAWDLRGDRGKTLRLRYHKTADSRTAKSIRLTDALPRRVADASVPGYHIHCLFGRLNDPNGLVYYEGQYHLFHQYFYGPRGKHWAHWVSDDLIHWKERPIGLYPDQYGSMHSGSATIDWFNTGGFQRGEQKTIVAAFTGSRGMGGKDKLQIQGIAYSTDGGRTFTKYARNPVLGVEHLRTLRGDNSRDPKVFRYSPTRGMDPRAKDGHWVMVLFEDGNHSLLTSPDLKKWTKTGQVEGFHECPELFELALDGDPAKRRWVMYGASGAYHVGTFDGKSFVPETAEKIPMRQGRGRIYASQTFDNMPGNPPRRVQVAWQGPQLSFPVELTLKTTDAGPRLCQEPVKEIAKLYGQTHDHDGLIVRPGGANPLGKITAPLMYIEAAFTAGSATTVTFDVRGRKIVYDAKARTLQSLQGKTSIDAKDGQVDLKILVDNWSIDVFAERGRVYMPALDQRLAPSGIGVRVDGDPVTFSRLKVHELGSIWGSGGEGKP